MTFYPQLLSRGASAAVFDAENDMVLKVGIRPASAVGNPGDHDFLVQAFCHHERRAYERLQALPDLVRFTPRYFGRADLSDWPNLTPPDGKVIVPGTGMLLEWLHGKEHKMGNTLEEPFFSIADRALDGILEVVGPCWPYDASAFVPGSRAEVALIDFAHWKDFDEHLEALGRDGALTEQCRDFISRVLAAP